MSTEELKMVLDAISSLGANGKEAFMWWMVITYGTKLLISTMVLTGVLGVPYMVIRAFARNYAKGIALESIGKRLGVDYYYWADCNYPGHSLGDVMEAFNRSIKS